MTQTYYLHEQKVQKSLINEESLVKSRLYCFLKKIRLSCGQENCYLNSQVPSLKLQMYSRMKIYMKSSKISFAF